MTPQERDLLESLANRVANTSISQKDGEADALIRDRIGSKPDALYVLTQTVLIQEMALNQANSRLHDLQQQLDTQRGQEAPQQHTSFLGRLFGTETRQPPPPPPSGYQGSSYQGGAPQYAQSGYAPGPVYQTPPLQYAPASAPGSFLRSAAATATGVAAGALAFEGIESLFGHGGGYGGGGFGGRPEETVINNYYEGGSDGESRERFADDQGSSEYGRFADLGPSNQDYQQDDSGQTDTDYDSANGDSGDDLSSSDV